MSKECEKTWRVDHLATGWDLSAGGWVSAYTVCCWWWEGVTVAVVDGGVSCWQASDYF